jgi:hypothetical protein
VSNHPTDDTGADLSRRDMISTMGTIAAGAFLLPPHVGEAMRHAQAAIARALETGVAYQPRVFTPQEWETVRMLVDYIIPRDSHSGSATDAGVPEFMDTLLTLDGGPIARHRAGLAWLDMECINRFGKFFTLVTDAQRRQVLDDIAWPAKARREMMPGVTWFNSFRDFTASGFYTSKIGIKDVGYMGNTGMAEWHGCPSNAVSRLVK